MPVAEAQDARLLLTASSTFGPAEVAKITECIALDPAQHRSLRDGVQELEQQAEPSPATRVRLGVGSYLLGRHQKAIEYLTRADGGALSHFYRAKSLLEVKNFQAGHDAFESAAKAGYFSAECILGRVEALRQLGRAEEAMALLGKLTGDAAQAADYHFQRGALLAALGEEPELIVAEYEKAVQLDPRHQNALFRLALENDRAGNDDTACDLYERSTQRFPPHLGSLLNLGVLYEDREQYSKAAQCYLRILAIDPEQPRAKLYLKDAEASVDMVVDEMAERRNDRMAQVMLTPVTDFELSVRSRNCLQKMGIKTLGDLTRITEQDLLGSKNFGETSLNEIKEMMTSRGLRLGQAVESKKTNDLGYDSPVISPDEQAVLGKSVNELNLSVRARKCMVRLGINSIGDLVRYSGDQLLECKNFGVTSLNEVRDRLVSYNLKLRGD